MNRAAKFRRLSQAGCCCVVVVVVVVVVAPKAHVFLVSGVLILLGRRTLADFCRGQIGLKFIGACRTLDDFL